MNGHEMTYAVMFFTWLITVSAVCFMPFVMRRNVAFGVSIPEGEYRHPFLVRLRRFYMITALTVGILLTAAVLLAGVFTGAAAMAVVNIAAIILFMVFQTTLYLFCHFKTKAFRKTQKWALKTVAFASLSSIGVPGPVSAWWFMTYPAILALTLGVTIWKYPSLPASIPVHFDAGGIPDRFVEKNIPVFLNFPVMQFLLGFLFFGLFLAVSRAKTQYAGGKTEEGLRRGARFRRIMANYLFGMGVAILLLFFILQLGMLYLIGQAVITAMPFIFLVGCVGVSVWLMLRVGQSGNRLRGPREEKPQSTVSDDTGWIGGFFYYNRNDPSLFVEKRFGIGYTINFGNPAGVAVTIGLVVFLVALTVLPLILD